jgi:hypothetical protein
MFITALTWPGSRNAMMDLKCMSGFSGFFTTIWFCWMCNADDPQGTLSDQHQPE